MVPDSLIILDFDLDGVGPSFAKFRIYKLFTEDVVFLASAGGLVIFN